MDSPVPWRTHTKNLSDLVDDRAHLIDQSDSDSAFSSAWQALCDGVEAGYSLADSSRQAVPAPRPSLVILDVS